MKLITILASRYVAGDTQRDAFKAIKKLNARGISATCDYLGENVLNRKKAQKATSRYIHIIEAIDRHKLNANISIKLTQLGLDIDNDFCLKNLGEILKKAKSLKNFVWLDMESAAYTDRTIEIYEHFMQGFPENIGICIQSYLRRSESDLKKLLNLHPAIRLVKGAYKETEQLSFPDKKDVDENFRKLAKMLIRTKPRLLAIATHDESIINDVISWLIAGKYDLNKVEFEMLYGIRRDLQEKLVKMGFKVRIYTPFGSQWLPYFYRRLCERKENVFFALKSILHK